MAGSVVHTLLQDLIKHYNFDPFLITQTELKPDFETYLILAAMHVTLSGVGQV